MKPKSARVRSRNSGVTRIPSSPHTTLVAGPDLAQLAAQRPPPVAHHDDRIHALALDLDPGAVDPHVGALVGRRVEVVRHAAVRVGGTHGGVLHVDRVAAERQQLLEQVLERRRASAPRP